MLGVTSTGKSKVCAFSDVLMNASPPGGAAYRRGSGSCLAKAQIQDRKKHLESASQQDPTAFTNPQEASVPQ